MFHSLIIIIIIIIKFLVLFLALYNPSQGLYPRPSMREDTDNGWLVGWYYLPTPPLGQDMTQGQFLSGV